MASSQVPKVTLNDGNQLPIIAFGTGSAIMKMGDPNINRGTVDQIKAAIEAGYRHLDAAEIYGTEAEVGIAIKESGVPRSELFVASKVFEGNGDIHASLKKSLELLQVESLDLYMLHQPFTTKSDEDLQKQWATMEEIKASGKAKSIGVSNYNQQQIETILKTAKVVPAVNQTEFHPYLQRGGLKAFLDSKKIALTAYSPWTPLVGQAKPGPLDNVLPNIAKQCGGTENQVLLKWLFDQGIVGVITTSNKQRLADGLNASKLEISSASLTEITEKGKEKPFRRWWGDFFKADDFS